uniref:Triadin-like n=2 Tax=Bursaphelenchus xylophilus TaxID=6326 RepID=A0A1I7SIW6_BURXY
MYPSEREPAGSDTDKTNAGTTTGNPKASADQTQVNKPSVFVAPPLENQNPVKESEKKDDASQKEGPPKVDSKQKESPVTDTPLETNKEMMKDPKGEKENKKDKKTEEEEQKKEKDK